MKRLRIDSSDGFGLVHAAIDAHTLGITSFQRLLEDCGFRCHVAGAEVCQAFCRPESPASMAVIERWIRDHRISLLGFSYRLDPRDGMEIFSRLLHQLRGRRLLAENGGPLRGLYFAGLPAACRGVSQRHPEVAGVFTGDETVGETLRILGLHLAQVPGPAAEHTRYDDDRLAFGREIIRRADYLSVRAPERGTYPGYGTAADTLMARIEHHRRCGLLPLIRAHVGPYLPDREEAVRLFLDWARQLAASGLLDVLSIGTSQLTQSHFGEDWGSRPNGGGVPLNSREEFAAVWQASRPMLVRTYAGTRDIPGLARMYEETIHIAWHALSLWWFCRLDGRGPYSLDENLRQQIETLRYIATTGKPFEPNVPHHFAFRGGDDVTYVVSGVLAARLAKRLGIRWLVLQNMLNTPKSTWGIQDLARSRALLRLVRELEDERFGVVLQPRAGLDYFSPDPERAKAQLAAATALMDDIEPHDPSSPPVIHVVSYSEASHLADPPTVIESIRIVHQALREYRRLRAAGHVPDMTRHSEVESRSRELMEGARAVLDAAEAHIPDLYSPDGLYRVFAEGFLPVPYLWECRAEFPKAVRYQTSSVRGSVVVVREDGLPMSVADRLSATLADLRQTGRKA